MLQNPELQWCFTINCLEPNSLRIDNFGTASRKARNLFDYLCFITSSVESVLVIWRIATSPQIACIHSTKRADLSFLIISWLRLSCCSKCVM